MDPGLPQGILYSAIGGLCAVIAYMGRLWIKHHDEALANWRAERAALTEANRNLSNELSSAIDRNTRTTAHLVTSMFFIPRELKRDSLETIRDIDDRQAEKEKRGGHV